MTKHQALITGLFIAGVTALSTITVITIEQLKKRKKGGPDGTRRK